jgi:hypothetical protein
MVHSLVFSFNWSAAFVFFSLGVRVIVLVVQCIVANQN